MPYYKTPDNTVHFLDSVQFEYLLPSEAVPITDAEAVELTKPAPVKVTKVSMRQARLALYQQGKLDTVNEIISLMPIESQRRQAEIEWEFATTVERNSSLVYGIAGGLGMTDADVDALFEQASKL